MTDARVATVTCSRREPEELLAALPADTELWDVRFSPRSRWTEWTAGRLQPLFGERYVHAKGFGNLNYKSSGEPVELADPELWLGHLQRTLAEGRRVWLMCSCPDRARCHRAVVADFLEARLGEPVPEVDIPASGPDAAGQHRLF